MIAFLLTIMLGFSYRTLKYKKDRMPLVLFIPVTIVAAYIVAILTGWEVRA